MLTRIKRFLQRKLSRFLGWVRYVAARDELDSCYDYDNQRFRLFSGYGVPLTRGKLEAKIIKEYHVVEKCLTMPNRSAGHGYGAVLNLYQSLVLFEKSFGDLLSNAQLMHAIGVLKEFVRVNNLQAGAEELRSVETFVSRFEAIPASCQIHTDREEFFRSNKSPFPEFAKSRHTIRSFSDKILDPGKIEDSVRCALNTPTACNRQYVRVKAIFDIGKVRKILSLQGGCRGFGNLATVVLLVVVDLEGVGSPLERNDVYTNGGMFLMNLCYALHYHEVAHCILNWSKMPSEDICLRQLVDLRDSETVVAVVACGEPTDEFDVALSPKRSLDEVLQICR